MAVANRTTPAGPYAAALRVLGLAVGLFFLFQWAGQADVVVRQQPPDERLREWLENAAPSVRWYIETLATPGVPLFARLVPLAELLTGAALIVGFWTRLAAFLALMMVANFNFARGMFHSGEFLTDGGFSSHRRRLLALTIAGTRLPFSVSKF